MNVDLLWNNFLEKIRLETNSIIYRTYFSNAKLISIDNKTLIISVKGQFIKDRFDKEYYATVLKIMKEITNIEYEAKIILEEDIGKYVKIKQESLFDSIIDKDEEIISPNEPNNNSPNVYVNNAVVYNHSSNLMKEYTFDNYVVGNSNRLAHGCAMSVADSPGSLYNPLVIYGDSGLGKTHLIHSIGNAIEKNSNKKVLYVTSEQFTDDCKIMKFGIGTTDGKSDVDSFKEKYRSIDVLIVDDIQALATKEKTQDEFFNTFNELYNNKKQIILTCDRKPDDIKDLSDRLKSRFMWGMAVTVAPPDFELRKNILYRQIKAYNFNQDLSDDIIEYIATNIGSNVRILQQSLNKLFAYKMIMGITNITLETAVEALKDLINKGGTSNQADILKIQRIVADFFQISVDDLKSKKRSSIISFPRQIAMYLSRSLLNESFEQIGLNFGGKDHTTVMHACEKIKNDVKTNQELFNTIEKIKQQIN